MKDSDGTEVVITNSDGVQLPTKEAKELLKRLQQGTIYIGPASKRE